MTRRPESPDVKASGGRGDLEPLRSGQPSEASNQKGRSESERTSRRKQAPHEADSSGHLELPRVFLLCPMASADTEELRRTYWGSRRKLKAAILESTAVKVRKVWGAGRMALECQDRRYNRRSREVRRSSSDWRMRSPSDEGWDNITHPERGPLGSGGCVPAEARTLGRITCERKDAAEGWSKRGCQWNGGVGLNSKGARGRLRPN